ncbi:Desulfoferrodoxin [bioreactor metagenome]|uniref:Desulfoferrodoxin n=1 Tax=bioreactor metagenome TaxID=1076179 RepID=A0A645AHN7_9ZZZZ
MKKFYRCNVCGNLIAMVNDSGVKPVCCDETMQELVPNTTDASNEKHVPVVEYADGKVTVTVGSVLHPMLPEHHIAWIYLLTEQGGYLKYLPVDGKPIAEFTLGADKPLAAYEYCNLHGLWKLDIK